MFSLYDCSIFQAKALYDFEGDTENGELTFTAGDTLFIVEQVRDKPRNSEASYEIMVLFVFHKLILQLGMHSHPVGLDV